MKASERILARGSVQLAIAAVATVLFAWLALHVVDGNADTFDRRWSLAIHGALDSDPMDSVMIALTIVGSGKCLYATILLVSLIAMRRRWEFSVILLANAVVAYAVNEVLKHWFMRIRPTLFDEITRPVTYSFPSGHAMSAMAVYGSTAAVLVALYPRRRWLIVSVAAILTIGVGLSRAYLGVHWPLDVLGGWICGIPFVIATVHIIHRLLDQTPREPAPPGPTPHS